MKKTLKDTGAAQKSKEKIDYLHLIRTSEPIESYSIKELYKRIEAARKEKARKSKDDD